MLPAGQGHRLLLGTVGRPRGPGCRRARRGHDQDQLPGEPRGIREDREGLLGARLHCGRRKDRRPRILKDHPRRGRCRRRRGLRGPQLLPARGHDRICKGTLFGCPREHRPGEGTWEEEVRKS